MKTLIAIVTSLALAGFAAAASPKPYPLKTCVVSDQTLGSMGEPFVFVHEGQEVQLCCSHCKPDFDKDPQKFMKKIQEGGK